MKTVHTKCKIFMIEDLLYQEFYKMFNVNVLDTTNLIGCFTAYSFPWFKSNAIRSSKCNIDDLMISEILFGTKMR